MVEMITQPFNVRADVDFDEIMLMDLPPDGFYILEFTSTMPDTFPHSRALFEVHNGSIARSGYGELWSPEGSLIAVLKSLRYEKVRVRTRCTPTRSAEVVFTLRWRRLMLVEEADETIQNLLSLHQRMLQTTTEFLDRPGHEGSEAGWLAASGRTGRRSDDMFT